jgi:hypothetical protein
LMSVQGRIERQVWCSMRRCKEYNWHRCLTPRKFPRHLQRTCLRRVGDCSANTTQPARNGNERRSQQS